GSGPAHVGDGRGRLAVDRDRAGRELDRVRRRGVGGHFLVEGDEDGRGGGHRLAVLREDGGHGSLVRAEGPADLFNDRVPSEEEVVFGRRRYGVVVHQGFAGRPGDGGVSAVVPGVD